MQHEFTERQRQYLAFIHRYTVKHGVAPSFEEIGTHFGTTAPSVNNMIKTLCARDLLARVPGVARSLRVLVPASRLGESELDSHRRRAPTPRPAGVSPADAAAAAAIAALDVLMPRLEDNSDAPRVVLEVARASAASLIQMGASAEEVEEVVRRLTAEVARWMPDGKAIRIVKRRWMRR